jgi:hypothetical protein
MEESEVVRDWQSLDLGNFTAVLLYLKTQTYTATSSFRP